jgi:uncharacterized protein
MLVSSIFSGYTQSRARLLCADQACYMHRQLRQARFKNTLASVPYQEVLVTVTGQDLRRIRREHQGRLVMEPVGSQAGTGSSLAGDQR